MFSVQRFRVQERAGDLAGLSGVFPGAFDGLCRPLPRMAVTKLRGVSAQAALIKAITSLNDLVVRRYWAWSSEFGFSEDFGG